MSADMGDEDWCVQESDDDTYNPAKYSPRVWEPLPKDVIDLYTKLSEDPRCLSVSWIMPGRRSPQVEKMEMQTEPEETAQHMEIDRPVVHTEFDFDDAPETNLVTPRRTPGHSKTPKSQKRVASMDKIMGDLFKNKKDQTASTPSRPVTGIKIRPMP